MMEQDINEVIKSQPAANKPFAASRCVVHVSFLGWILLRTLPHDPLEFALCPPVFNRLRSKPELFGNLWKR